MVFAWNVERNKKSLLSLPIKQVFKCIVSLLLD